MSAVRKLEASGVGMGPYKFLGYREIAHPVAGYFLDGSPNPSMGFVAGGACDCCGTGIRHSYRFRDSRGVEYAVGVDCAEKALLSVDEWKEQKRAMYGARKEHERAEARRIREAAEREQNGGKTNVEIREEVRLERLAEAKREAEREAARKAASQHIGTVGERIEIDLFFKFRASWEGYYGITALYSFLTAEGNSVVVRTTSGLGHFEEGEQVRLRGTIAEHGKYKGEKQTRLQRAKVL